MFAPKKRKNKNYTEALISNLSLSVIMIRLNSLFRHTIYHSLIIGMSLTACCAENKQADGTVHIHLNNADLVYNDPYHRYINEGSEGGVLFTKNLATTDTSGDHLKFLISPRLNASAVGTASIVAEFTNSELTW